MGMSTNHTVQYILNAEDADLVPEKILKDAWVDFETVYWDDDLMFCVEYPSSADACAGYLAIAAAASGPVL